MRVFKTRVFDRWAGKAGITDTALLRAVADIERGLIDADLGSNLFSVWPELYIYLADQCVIMMVEIEEMVHTVYIV